MTGEESEKIDQELRHTVALLDFYIKNLYESGYSFNKNNPLLQNSIQRINEINNRLQDLIKIRQEYVH